MAFRRIFIQQAFAKSTRARALSRKILNKLYEGVEGSFRAAEKKELSNC